MSVPRACRKSASTVPKATRARREARHVDGAEGVRLPREVGGAGLATAAPQQLQEGPPLANRREDEGVVQHVDAPPRWTPAFRLQA
eukprot:702222-Alexandrium_andersonii.AAC.1